MSLAIIGDLRVDEVPEIKLIKHMCRNDPGISIRFKEVATKDVGFNATLNVKL